MKSRSEQLDEINKTIQIATDRIRLPSGNWKSHKEDTVDWNEQSKAEIWRHGWEVVTNDYLERNNRPERVDLRSFERQGIDLAPTIHLGPAVTQMEKRGIETDMGNGKVLSDAQSRDRRIQQSFPFADQAVPG